MNHRDWSIVGGDLVLVCDCESGSGEGETRGIVEILLWMRNKEQQK